MRSRRRQSPYRHRVRSHTRKGRPVKTHMRGKGKMPHNPGYRRVKVVEVNDHRALIDSKIIGDMNPKFGVLDKEEREHFAEEGYRFTPKTATLESITVEEEEESKGYGKQMLDWVENESKRRGMDRVMVWRVYNPGFFLANGYYATDEDASIMVKDFTGKPWKQVIKETITYDPEDKTDLDKVRGLVRAARGFVVKGKKYPKKVLEYARTRKTLTRSEHIMLRGMTLKEVEEWFA